MPGQVQVVPWDVLEGKLGRKLNIGDIFETATGKWKVLAVTKSELDAYTIEKMEND